MGLNCAVGGARGTFAGPMGGEVASLLDQAFGAEGDWEGEDHRTFGELAETDWTDIREKVIATLGSDAIPNLLSVDPDGRGVFLPANVQAVRLILPGGLPLQCASLPGLRRELFDLAEHWELPVDDRALLEILRVAHDPDDGVVADPPEFIAFARLTLAANEAMRQDCPLWLVG